MRVILIQPFGGESNTNYPPMGLLYLASFLRAKSGHEVRIIDLRVNKTPIEDKLPEILEWRPDVVGLTGLSIEWTGFKRVAEMVRAAMGDQVTIVAGGPHATIFSKMVLQKTTVDCVVRNEGEETLVELLQALETGSNTAEVKGLVIRQNNGEIEETPARAPAIDFDAIPFPAYDLLNMEDYFRDPHFHGNLNKYKRILPLITSRGCPFKCNFCHHAFGYSFRPRSPESVLEEIDWLVKEYKIREIQIEDDTFNFKIDRAKDIMRRIVGRKYRLAIAFPNGVKPNLIDEELMGLFKEGGVYRIHYGIETVVPRVQEIVNKPLDMNKLDHVIDMTSRANISAHGFFMIGLPTETEDEIQQTIKYAVESKLATANFSIMKVFPGTPFGERYLKDTQMFDDDSAFGYDSTATNVSAVPDEKLKELQKWAMRVFYFRPSRIWRIFRTSPNKSKLFYRNLFTVLSLIFRGKTKY